MSGSWNTSSTAAAEVQPSNMLCANTYTKDDIDDCRSRMESRLAAYKALVATAREKTGSGTLNSMCVLSNFDEAIR